MNIQFFLLLGITLAFSNVSYADSQEEKVLSLPIPSIIERKINEHAQGGSIKRIKKEKIVLLEKGDKVREIYLAKILKLDRKKIWVTIDENGELLSIEDVSMDEVLEDMGKNNKTKFTKRSMYNKFILVIVNILYIFFLVCSLNKVKKFFRNISF